VADPSPSEFSELLSRASHGDATALDEIARRYEPKVRVVARVLLGPALRPYLDSMDLAQSVHKSILVGLRESKFHIDGPEQLVALALTVLRRKAAKHWRHLRRQRRLSGDGVARDSEDLPGLLVALSDSRDDPAEVAQLQDQLEHLRGHLDEVERHILDLRLEGYTPSEIADRMGVSRVALRVRLTRLRQRLQSEGAVADWL
jgi:RNA polymerase sigma-70 factor (ECF subfamily)